MDEQHDNIMSRRICIDDAEGLAARLLLIKTGNMLLWPSVRQALYDGITAGEVHAAIDFTLAGVLN